MLSQTIPQRMMGQMSGRTDPGAVSDLIRSHLARRSSAPMMVLSVLLIAGIGITDRMTGYHLSLGLFYVAPVSLLSWYGSRRAGLLGASACAMTWLLANSFTAPPEVLPMIIVWNTLIRFGFFAIIATLLTTLHDSLVREEELARVDHLTGLMNSRAFHESADLELMRARRGEYPLTLLYLDLDHFKKLNDRLGHVAGDAVLVTFARALQRGVRATDLVCRIGGDEFVVMLPNTSREQGERVASKIHELVSGDDQLAGHGIAVSIGAVTVDAPPSTIDELVAVADAAMYEAKRAGTGTGWNAADASGTRERT